MFILFQYVDENYEGELQEAILQSKLEFEQNKDCYDRVKKEMEAEKKQAATGGKKKKSKVMSLEEFKNLQVFKFLVLFHFLKLMFTLIVSVVLLVPSNLIYFCFSFYQDNVENGIEDKESSGENSVAPMEDPEFFDRIKQEAKQVIKKEQTKRILKEREVCKNAVY